MRILAGIIPMALAAAAAAEIKGTLKAGAARVDITPPADAALPMSGYASRTQGFQGVHDHLYARAIVVDDGANQAAIVVADLSSIGNRLWENVSRRISAEAGIPSDSLLLAATHTHGGPSLGYLTDDPPEKLTAYTAAVEDNLVEAVKKGKAALQPARMGVGVGRANVNMNRRARLANGGWWLGYNPDGPSDKRVPVVKFDTLSGEPIAVLINYAVHGTMMSGKNLQITADLPGSTSRFVEQHYQDKIVAAWTSGAGGDQNPIYRDATWDQVKVLGQIVGEEALRVMENIKTSPRMRIRAQQAVVTCPGKQSPPGGRRRREDNRYEFIDAGPVDIRLSLVMLNNVAITAVSGEVLVGIQERLRKESPFANTMMITHANGSSGYIPADADYETVSYEIVSTRVKRGCAEGAIVNGLLDLMDRN